MKNAVENSHPKVLSENGNELFFDEQGNLMKEEPKQEMPIINGSYGCIIRTHETLEEVAEKLTKDFPHYSVRDNMDDSEIKGWFLEALQKGAKWQQERSYSEEEVKFQTNKLLNDLLYKQGFSTNVIGGIVNEWFEQFKNVYKKH